MILFPSSVIGQEFTNGIDTTFPWDIKPDKPIQVIINAKTSISVEKIDAIKKVIMSENSFTKDGKTFYEGWRGALNEVSEHSTRLSIPTTFNIIESYQAGSKIIITLTPSKDANGNSGFTRSVVEHHRLVGANITIYDIDSLTVKEITTITRHEFGHALGLGHSTDPEDLMYEEIITLNPFISDCHINAITELYNEKTLNHILCEK
ncbi:MAG: matrixin family metalloprotease [Nitrosopumilaceae archaeon]